MRLVPKGYGEPELSDAKLCILIGKGMLMSAADGWEKVTLMVDSGASDTVVPPSVCKIAEIHTTSKVGIEFECANGRPLYNLGERRCDAMLSEGGDVVGMAFQVVDVGRALSVSRVCAQGHDVVFSEKKGSFIHLDEILGKRCHYGTLEVCLNWMCGSTVEFCPAVQQTIVDRPHIRPQHADNCHNGVGHLGVDVCSSEGAGEMKLTAVDEVAAGGVET